MPIPDAHLLRDTDSVCGDSGVPAPQTRDLSMVTFARADASPAGGSGADGGRHSQRADRQTGGHSTGRGATGLGALLEAGLLCPRWPGVTSLPA